MLKSVEHNHELIVSNGSVYDQETYRRHLLACLLTGPNAKFNNKMTSINSDVEAGSGYNANITPAQLIAAAKKLYINIDARKGWNSVDPKDAKIMALTTALKDSKQQPSGNPPKSHTKFNGDSKEPKVEGCNTLELWRTIKKGDTLEKFRKTWTWCPHHKSDKFGYDGLYYSSHTADTHDAWRQDKSGFTSGKKREHGPDKNKSKETLHILEGVKTTLCTNFCCSEEDLDKILADDSLN